MANTKIQLSILFIFLLVSINLAFEVKVNNQSDNSSSSQKKLQQPQKKIQAKDIHMNCIDSSFKLIKKQPVNSEEHHRILQTSNPHPFVIHGQFPASAPAGINVDVSVLQKMFKISANYFKQVLQVTDLPAGSTTYPYSNNCFNSVVPNNLKTTGFDQSQMDLYVFIQIVNDTAASFVAQAGPCVILRWPTYGMTRYNAYYVSTNLVKTGTFHNNIMTTLHQISHILGVSNSMFQQVYGSYTSTTQLTNSSIFGTSSNGKNMIILPNTKAYIQAYFGCTNTSVGAVIEDQGSSGSVGSHWERKVFYDDYMTASVWSSGAKLTQLSLAYFQDTGFYYSVDRTIAQPTYFGKNKGCAFAIGNDNTSTPQYCMTTDALDCGFSSQYGGPCNSNDQFDSGINLQRPYSNVICNMKQTIDGGLTTANQHYDWDGRCFMIQAFPRCLKAVCTASGIQINVFGAQTVVCGPTATSVSSIYGTVPCPSNYDAFCGRRSCQNWCYTQGMCMKGSCILLPCSQAINSCLTCVTDKIHRCTSCSGGLYPSADRLSCDTCGNIISGCLTCVVYLGNTVCTSCNNGNFPDLFRQTCVACNTASPNCLSCSVVNGFTVCSSCNGGYTTNSLGVCITSTCSISNCNQCLSVGGVSNCLSCSTGFPTSNYLACNTCSNIIANCQTCTFTTATICQTCNSGYAVINFGLSCQISSGTPCTITNCLTCTNTGSQVCTSCANGLFPSNDGSACIACRVKISNCNNSCSNNGTDIVCSLCDTGYYLASNSLSCSLCSGSITDCSICSNNAGTVTCTQCLNSKYPSSGLSACNTCGNLITDCNSCSFNTTNTLCTSCGNGKIISSDSLTCEACTITDCSSCINSSGFFECVSCLNSLFPASNLLSCVSCQTRIPNCDSASCVDNSNGNITCSLCSTGFLIANTLLNSSCSACSSLITNCNQCSRDGSTNLICSLCSSSFYISDDTFSCVTCGQKISSCTTCTDNGTDIICSACTTNFFPSSDSLTCQPCDIIISDCQTCSYNGTDVICDACFSGFVYSLDHLSCGNCDNSITNCLQCADTGSNINCTQCCAGYFISDNTLSCIICTNNITNCDQCFNNGGTVQCSLCSSGFFLTSSNLNCDICGNIISQCSSCSFTTQTVCDSCNNGFILSGDKLSCGDCSGKIANCQATSCNNNTGVYKCTLCTSSLYPSTDGISCVSCNLRITDCSTCVDNGNNNITCSACSANYLNQQNTACTTCSNIIQGCNTCSYNTTHTICNQCLAVTNFPTQDQLACSPCDLQINQCQTCSYSAPTLTCVQCFNNKFPTIANDVCDLCGNIISNCQKCSYSTQTDCDVCLDGFILLTGSCSPCDSNCTTCSGLSTTCTSCQQGYVVDQNNQCKQNAGVIPSFSGTCDLSGSFITCDYGCLYCQCSSFSSKTCLTPMQGFAVTGAGGVVQCGSGCKTCDPNDPTGTCFTCFNEYTLLISGLCSRCHSSCSTCNPTNQNICLTCPQTFQLNSNNQCSKCSVDNCKICQSSGVCSICRDGFYVSSQGACQQCVSNCGSCLQADIAACTGCRDMYYLQSTTRKCAQCPQGCLTCDQTLTCSSCTQRYQISLADNKCYKTCQFPCFTCSATDSSDCKSCLGGYSLTNLQGKGACNQIKTCTGICNFCPLGTSISGSTCTDCLIGNCASCASNVNQCQSCKPGFYLGSPTSCLACPTQCKSCKSIDYCFTCTPGFTKIKQNSQKLDKVMKGKCIACQSPCKTCQRATTRCTSCVQGYKLQKYICKLQNSVTFNLEINIPYNDFMSKKMFKALKKLIAQLFSFGNVNFIFHQIKSGSTIVQGEVGNPIGTSGVQLCSQSQQMQSSLASGSSVEGYGILSSSMLSSDGQNSCSTSNSDNTIYIIIAVGVGLPLLIILIIVIAVCIKKSRDKDKGKRIGDKSKINQNDTKADIQIYDLE